MKRQKRSRKNKYGIYNTKSFIEYAQNIYNDKNFDYSQTHFVNMTSEINIICHEIDKDGFKHGIFKVRPVDFLERKSHCHKCTGNIYYKNLNDFKERFHSKYPDKENYIIIDGYYKNNKTKIPVFCKKMDENGNQHGLFYIRPNDLISGYGCPKCGGKQKLTTEEFIKRAKKVHGNKYDYSKTEYKDCYKKVCIRCVVNDKNGNEHGEFWQTPINHLNGCGCPRCNCGQKSKIEERVGLMLDKKIGDVERQKTFEWLKYERNLYLDFYIDKYKIAVEVQGEQHFVNIKKWGGEENLILRRKRDEEKKRLCEEHNIKLFYITKDNENIYEILDYINNETTK